MSDPQPTGAEQLLRGLAIGDDGTLRSVLDPFLRNIGSVQILWPPSRHQAPKVKAFVDFMAQHLLTDR